MSTSGKRALTVVLLLALGVGIGIAADRLWRTRAAEPASGAPPDKAAAGDEEEPEPAAVVRTVIVSSGELPRQIDALGVAAVPPSATVTESWPTDVVVSRFLVQPGEVVAVGAPVVQVSPTHEAETQFAAAQLALESTTEALDLVRQRLERGLATRTDLIAAEHTQSEARQRLDRLQLARPPADGLLHAHGAGTIGALRVQPGAAVTAGTPILDIGSDAVVAQVGIDPADVPGLAVGQEFDVRPVDERNPGRWKGSVSLIAHSVNPTSRLVDALLTLSGDPLPRAGTSLRARAVLPGATGILVPRAALTPDGEEMIVYLARDGTAVRSPVTVAQSGRERVVISSGVAPGDHVVVSGQSQLTAGATVREVTTDSKPVKPSGGDGADR